MALAALFFAACETHNINPYDYAGSGTAPENQGAADGCATALAQYPAGALVWSRDTTLHEPVEIPEGTALYIEPGVRVTCAADARVPVELVVLGNLYCMGTAEQPVVFDSDKRQPADWGGIICGYNCTEVVLSHVEVAHAGATPTESSLSFQHKLFKTTIDGGVPAFHFCNVSGKFVMARCFLHDNYNDQTYFTGGNGLIYGCTFADSGNAADGGEAINVKSGCRLDVADNLIYNACTNAFKLSNAGNSELVPLTEMTAYNNTMVNCGWRRSKNKKGGSVWLEKAAKPVFVNNIIYDCRFGMKQPKQDGADMAAARLTPNWYFASTATGVAQMSPEADLMMCFDTDIRSAFPGDADPQFAAFAPQALMDINCEVDDPQRGAPVPFSPSFDFGLRAGSPAATGGVADFLPLFPSGLPMMGMKAVRFVREADDQDYRFQAPAPSTRFGCR